MARDRNRQWQNKRSRQPRKYVTIHNGPTRAAMTLIQNNKKHHKHGGDYCPSCSELWTDCWCVEK